MRLDFIRPLYERRGPYSSVYLDGYPGGQRDGYRDGTPEGEGAARWRALREELERAGATVPDVLEREALRPARGRAVFATRDDVVLSEPLAGPPPRPIARFAPLPHLAPLLMARGENVPHLRVVIDRAGARLTVFGGGSPRTAATEPVDWPLQKTARGGWSQRFYDDTWDQDAEAVAREIDEQVRRIGADLVLMAGEPKACSLLGDRLGTKSADRMLIVDDGSRPEHDVEAALDEWLDRRRADLLERHREQVGPVGVAQVAHALREGRARAVLMPGELPRQVWIGGGGTQMATSAAELRGWGVTEPVTDRADAALIRAAAMTDTELWFTGEVADAAAVLRH